MGHHHRSKRHHRGHHHHKHSRSSSYSTLSLSSSCSSSRSSDCDRGKLVKAHDVYKLKSLSSSSYVARPPNPGYNAFRHGDAFNIIVGRKKNGKYVKCPRHLNVYS